ncbi:MAG: biotin/lipoyl-containing protein [Spirochaetia bacterium]|jgi:pyruvate dehydrogenase E2 component (dihydrolipoamide acetyltransferase)
MIREVKLLKIGLTMQSGTITKWYKQEGDQVQEDEPFFEVETDKATQTVVSLETGIVKKLLVQAGEEVPVGTVIALVGDRNDLVPLNG